MGFLKSLENKDNVVKINKNASFWKVHSAALQRALFLYIGRLSDDGRDCKSFTDFNNHCVVNAIDFGQHAFKKRKGSLLSGQSNPPSSAFPTKEDICKLHSLSKGYNGYLRKECKTIRSRIFAHPILIEEYEYEHLFEKVTLSEIEKALLAYYSVSKYLWHSYHNAEPLGSEVLPHPDKEIIYKTVLKVINNNI